MRVYFKKQDIILYILITAIALPSLLLPSGCGVPSKETRPTLVIWHWMTDRQAAFEELARRYETKTGIRVNFELYAPSDAYSQKVRAAAQTSTLPDIYGILAEPRDIAAFIKSGHVANLSGAMETDNSAWKNALFPKALAIDTYKSGNVFGVPSGIYAVPIDVMNIQMLYNKKLFQKAGLNPGQPPATWKEFLEAAQKLRTAGIIPFVSGWGEIWMIDCLANNYAYNIMGEGKIIDTIRGKIPYTDPDWVAVFALFKDMADSGVLASGIVTMVNKQAEQAFANERAAMTFNGSWCVNVYAGMNPGLDYGVFLPPRASEKYPMVIWGGPGSSLRVNDRSTRKAEAIAFLRWMTDVEQQIFLTKETKNLPSNRQCIGDISPVLSQFADDMDRTVDRRLLPVVEEPLVVEAFDKGIQSIIIGEKDPDEVALHVQSVKIRELKRRDK